MRTGGTFIADCTARATAGEWEFGVGHKIILRNARRVNQNVFLVRRFYEKARGDIIRRQVIAPGAFPCCHFCGTQPLQIRSAIWCVHTVGNQRRFITKVADRHVSLISVCVEFSFNFNSIGSHISSFVDFISKTNRGESAGQVFEIFRSVPIMEISRASCSSPAAAIFRHAFVFAPSLTSRMSQSV